MNRNGKVQVLTLRNGGGGDADHLPGGVEQGAAAAAADMAAVICM